MKEIYGILSGVLGQEQRLAQVSNNLANVSTTGFKRDGSAFVNYLQQEINGQSPDAAGSAADPAAAVYPVLARVYSDQGQGVLQRTARDLDLAIDGPGFFQVRVSG